MTIDPHLRNLFVEGLRRLHAAHHQGAAQARQNIGSSSLPKLKRMLTAGHALNLVQARRLEAIFKALGRDIETRTDRAMGGIAESNQALVAKAEGRATRDLANIGCGQVAAHFYIATYGTLRAYAVALGLREAVTIFDRALAETRVVDRALTRLSARIVAKAGHPGYPAESALYTTAALHPARTAAVALAVAIAGAASVVAFAPPRAEPMRRRWARG